MDQQKQDHEGEQPAESGVSSLSDDGWVIAWQSHGGLPQFCDRCGEPSGVLYRRYGVLNLHDMICVSCTVEDAA